MEKNISDKRKNIRDITLKLKAAKSELEKMREHLAELEKGLNKIEGLLEKRLVAYYKYAKRGYLKILATAKGIDELNHRMKYLRVIMSKDRQVLEQMAVERSGYRRELSSVQERMTAIAELEEAEGLQLSMLNDDLEKKVLLLAKIHREKDFYETAVKELEAAAVNMKEKILNAEKEVNSADNIPGGFIKAKGRLPYPLRGSILDSKKIQDRPFATHKGIYLAAPFGTDVKAVFPGRVDYSGQLKGYGQVIVLNHGDRYFSIYAFLLQRDRLEGDMVREGDLLGQVGESGFVTGPALYFEIREGEKSLDPVEWLKVN
jgi:septal ring factor EnvC (AmiA/AmiB activator)